MKKHIVCPGDSNTHGYYAYPNDIAEFNEVDYMHLTRKGNGQLAAKLAGLIPTLV